MPTGVYKRTEIWKKKMSERMSGEGNSMFGIHLTGKDSPSYGKPRSEATKVKISKAKKGIFNGGGFLPGEKHLFFNKPRSKRDKDKISKTEIKYYQDHPEVRKGKKNGHYGKPAYHAKGSYYKGIWMRSSWEIKIAEWLDKQNWRWLYETKRFELKDRTYCPDFYLPDLNVWWEIKGWFHERHQETIRQFRELYPCERLVVITKETYKNIIKKGG